MVLHRLLIAEIARLEQTRQSNVPERLAGWLTDDRPADTRLDSLRTLGRKLRQIQVRAPAR